MTKIKIEIKDCSQCPFFDVSPYPTNDSFERPEYWWCCHPDNKEIIIDDPESEKHRQFIVKRKNVPNVRMIDAYVEWYNKIPVPNWCLIRID